MDERTSALARHSARRSSLGRLGLRGVAIAALPMILGLGEAIAQADDGDAFDTIGGAALGLYSGGFFGVVGGLLPCDRTVRGRLCVAASGVTGGAVGLVAGGVLGSEDGEEIRERAWGAGYGTLIGAAVGVVLQQAVRQYAWNDALLVAAFGAAVGAAPRGALFGTGIGAAVGAGAWAFSPRGGIQDLIMFTLVGSMLGGLYDWVDGAADARRDRGPALTSTFSIGVG